VHVQHQLQRQWPLCPELTATAKTDLVLIGESDLLRFIDAARECHVLRDFLELPCAQRTFNIMGRAHNMNVELPEMNRQLHSLLIRLDADRQETHELNDQTMAMLAHWHTFVRLNTLSSLSNAIPFIRFLRCHGRSSRLTTNCFFPE